MKKRKHCRSHQHRLLILIMLLHCRRKADEAAAANQQHSQEAESEGKRNGFNKQNTKVTS